MELIDAIVRHFRSRRMRRFEQEFSITGQTRILDVGGTPLNWRLLSAQPQITILNTTRESVDARFTWVWGDGRILPFRDQSFDIVFSNSVIEHVGDTSSQQRFAAEIARVGKAYWVQTPNRLFPIEPHLFTMTPADFECDQPRTGAIGRLSHRLARTTVVTAAILDVLPLNLPVLSCHSDLPTILLAQAALLNAPNGSPLTRRKAACPVVGSIIFVISAILVAEKPLFSA